MQFFQMTPFDCVNGQEFSEWNFPGEIGHILWHIFF